MLFRDNSNERETEAASLHLARVAAAPELIPHLGQILCSDAPTRIRYLDDYDSRVFGATHLDAGSLIRVLCSVHEQVAHGNREQVGVAQHRGQRLRCSRQLHIDGALESASHEIRAERINLVAHDCRKINGHSLDLRDFECRERAQRADQRRQPICLP